MTGHSDETARALAATSRPSFNGDALNAYQPRQPAGSPWADYWYCYVNDPDVGYFKIAFISYLLDGADNAQRAYLHIAFFPLGGGFREYDFHADRVVLEPGADKTYAFRFEVPGRAVITETRFELTLPEASIVTNLRGEHSHYWNGCNPANGPFTPETPTLPDDKSHWFIFTLGTHAEYEFRDGGSEHRGSGMTYIERGWSSAAAPGFTYLVATSQRVRLMLVEGGKSSGGVADAWAGRVDIGDHSLRLLPVPGDHIATSEIDGAGGAVSLNVEQASFRLELRAQAPVADYYDQVTPSQTVFGAQSPVMKTMNAPLEIALYRDGTLVEHASLPQSLIEFAGAAYPADRQQPNQSFAKA